MSGLDSSGEYSDVLDDSWLQGIVAVGATQVEVKVGASKSATREMIIIHNSSNNTIYYGPTGITTSTGIPLFKNQWVEIMAGNHQSVFMIAASAGNNVIIAEVG